MHSCPAAGSRHLRPGFLWRDFHAFVRPDDHALTGTPEDIKVSVAVRVIQPVRHNGLTDSGSQMRVDGNVPLDADHDALCIIAHHAEPRSDPRYTEVRLSHHEKQCSPGQLV